MRTSKRRCLTTGLTLALTWGLTLGLTLGLTPGAALAQQEVPFITTPDRVTLAIGCPTAA